MERITANCKSLVSTLQSADNKIYNFPEAIASFFTLSIKTNMFDSNNHYDDKLLRTMSEVLDYVENFYQDFQSVTSQSPASFIDSLPLPISEEDLSEEVEYHIFQCEQMSRDLEEYNDLISEHGFHKLSYIAPDPVY